MRSATCWFALLAFSAVAQVAPDSRTAPLTGLNSDLLALQHANASNAVQNSQRLADEIMSLADTSKKPSRLTVAKFADALCSALAGRTASKIVVSELSTAIYDVLHSGGLGTYRFHQIVSRAEKNLTSGGVDDDKARVISGLLSAVGDEVRGPEDIGLQPLK